MRVVQTNDGDRARASSESPAPDSKLRAILRRPRWLRAIPELVALALCVVLWTTANTLTSSVGGPGPALYPRVLIGLLAVTMIVRLFEHAREHRRGAVASGDTEFDAVPEEGAELDESLIDSRQVGVAILLAVVYVLASIFLGWVLATFVFTILFLVLAGKRNPLIVLPMALVLSLGFAYVFVKLVYISLPTGIGVFDLVTVRLFETLGIY